jgi:adenylate cyclase
MNSIEIERKFLVRSDAWRAGVHKTEHYRQGYLNDEVYCSVRVRICGQDAWLNLKSVTLGAQRHEFEYVIPLADAELMLDTLTRKPLVEKTRHFVDVGLHTWEVDVFEGDNAGLVVAEIELERPDESFEMPDWAGEEVTYDPRYYNTNLANHPYKTWTR